LPRATHDGDLKLDNRIIKAAVLPNGKRLLTQGTMLEAIGRSPNPKGGTGVLSNVDGLPFFLLADQLTPFISEELRQSTTPIFFRLKDGRKAVGYDAQLLPMVCDVYLKFRDACLEAGKTVPRQYQHIVKACDLLMRGLANVGIVALVDEATGYQEVRDRMALQKILEKYITDEWAKWTKTFPDDFYRQLFRLKGLQYPPQNMKKPSYVGHWTNDIVYARLAPGVLDALRKVNPRDITSGLRRHKHHQHLTPDYGHPALKEHLSNVIFLMKSCDTDADFKHRLDIAAPKQGETLSLPLSAK
jgi:P63C domain